MSERTDTERMDWLSKSFGLALLDDDNGHWGISFSGMQNVPEGDAASEIWSSFHLRPKDWHESARAAVDAAMDGAKKNKTKRLKVASSGGALPCPFCGNRSIQTKVTGWRMARYCYGGCEATGPESDCGLSERAAKKQSTERWNARAALANDAQLGGGRLIIEVPEGDPSRE